jgi:hypothetical protein
MGSPDSNILPIIAGFRSESEKKEQICDYVEWRARLYIHDLITSWLFHPDQEA